VFQEGGPFAGKTIGEVAAGLRSGAINPSELPLDVITRDYSCDQYQLDAYDKLVEVHPSSWVEGLLARRPKSVPTGPVKHYRIYFDNVGCYEVAAEDFELPNK
jgi:hypothetical protein